MKLEPGHKAPSFTLVDSDKKKVTLEDHRGKNVVLLFFPAAFTGTCTRELCQARDEMSYYNDVNAQVLGISVDLPFTLAKYKQEQQYNFPLLSDFNKEASTAYDAIYHEWIHGLKGVSKRASFVIDKEGVIRFAEVLENAGDYPDFAGIRKTLDSLS
jgi:glutaredoxin-dependent peroxiredoxin